MKQSQVICAAILSLFCATAAIAQHQRDAQGTQQRGQSKPSTQSHQTQPAQQASRPAQSQARPQQTYGGAYHGGVQRNGPTYGGVHASGVPQHPGQVRDGFVQSRAGSWNNEHQTWSQRGGYNGYRIPDARFRLYFGRDHFFRIYGLPLVFVGGQPRFQYDGYWVTIVDPWPGSWGPNWYETDDVYLDNTGDGYYLYDRNYPDYPIAVTVSF